MSRSKHTEAQMIASIKQIEAGCKAEATGSSAGWLSTIRPTIAWKSKYGGMDVSEVQASEATA